MSEIAKTYASMRIGQVRDLVRICKAQRKLSALSRVTGLTRRSIYAFLDDESRGVRADNLFILEFEAEILLGLAERVEDVEQPVE